MSETYIDTMSDAFDAWRSWALADIIDRQRLCGLAEIEPHQEPYKTLIRGYDVTTRFAKQVIEVLSQLKELQKRYAIRQQEMERILKERDDWRNLAEGRVDPTPEVALHKPCAYCDRGDCHLCRPDLVRCPCAEDDHPRRAKVVESACGCVHRSVNGQWDPAPYVLCVEHEGRAA